VNAGPRRGRTSRAVHPHPTGCSKHERETILAIKGGGGEKGKKGEKGRDLFQLIGQKKASKRRSLPLPPFMLFPCKIVPPRIVEKGGRQRREDGKGA